MAACTEYLMPDGPPVSPSSFAFGETYVFPGTVPISPLSSSSAESSGESSGESSTESPTASFTFDDLSFLAPTSPTPAAAPVAPVAPAAPAAPAAPTAPAAPFQGKLLIDVAAANAVSGLHIAPPAPPARAVRSKKRKYVYDPSADARVPCSVPCTSSAWLDRAAHVGVVFEEAFHDFKMAHLELQARCLALSKK